MSDYTNTKLSDVVGMGATLAGAVPATPQRSYIDSIFDNLAEVHKRADEAANRAGSLADRLTGSVPEMPLEAVAQKAQLSQRVPPCGGTLCEMAELGFRLMTTIERLESNLRRLERI